MGVLDGEARRARGLHREREKEGMNVDKLLNLNLSRIFKCDARTLFEAVAEGALFRFTGARMNQSSFDFKVGGAIALAWSDTDTMTGAFTEIRPYERIAFTCNLSTPETGA